MPSQPEPSDESERHAKLFRVLCHDLKEPIAAIEMATTVLQRALAESGKEERASRIAQAIERSAQRMDSLVRNCVDFFEIDSGRVPLEIREQPIGAILDAVRVRSAAGAKAKGIHVAWTISTPEPRLVCDGPRVTRALEQLIGNAIKYGHERCGVTVAATQRDSFVVLRIADDGPGLTADCRANVFDPYWLASRSPRDGTGLGIAVAKGLVEAHGGSLALEPPTRGTSWVIELPRAR